MPRGLRRRPPAGDALLTARGVVVEGGARRVLDAVDLELRRREIVTLVGPNGAGKTTLIRACLGLRRPDAGQVSPAPGLAVGYVPQKLALDPSLPLAVERFVRLAGGGGRRAARAALERAGAAHLGAAAFQELSGGEARRVLLAAALLGEPDLLALDEPDAGLDVTGRRELCDLLAALRDERGCGILMASHDLHMVMAATDRVVCLNHHVCCSGRPESIVRRPEYLALFGPELAPALAVYTHHHDHRHDLSGAPHAVEDADG